MDLYKLFRLENRVRLVLYLQYTLDQQTKKPELFYSGFGDTDIRYLLYVLNVYVSSFFFNC